ncbi:MAG: hypothetical protein ABEH65_00345 [Halobacteriales archaeon]
MADSSGGQTGPFQQLIDDRDLLVAIGMAAGLGIFLYGMTRNPLVAVSAFLLATVAAVLVTT